jgi:hypothetical protein
LPLDPKVMPYQKVRTLSCLFRNHKAVA